MRGRPRSSSRCRPRRPGVSVIRSSPLASTYVRSASATVRCARCSTSRMVTPRSRIAASAAKTASTIVGARPSDGSSSRSTSGSATSARPIASCCCWPPESAPAWRRTELGQHRKEVVGRGERASEPFVRRAREPEPQVLLDGQLAEDAPALRARARSRRGRSPPARGRAATSRRAGRRRAEAGTTPMIACSVVDLPGAVRPDQADELGPVDLEAEPAHGGHGAVADVERARARASALTRPPRSRPGRPTVTSRLAADLRGRPLGERPALVEHVDPVADLHHERHVVVDQEHAGVVVLRIALTISANSRHLRLRHARLRARPGARSDGAAASAGRRRAGARRRARAGSAVASSCREPEPREQLGRRARAPRRAGPDAERRDLDVLPHRQSAERAAVLERPRDPGAAAPVRAPAGDVALAELDRARRRGVEAAEHVHERRLAGAVRADQADDLVPVQLERDVRRAPARP